MVSVEDIRAQVEAAWATVDVPEWPNRRAGGREPLDEEYSRVTAPERFTLVHARARTWTAVLERVLGVRAEAWLPTSGEEATGEADGRFVRGVKLTSPLPGVLPLFLIETDDPLPMLRIAVADASWALEDLPDCGCDACDHGSVMLCEAIDDTIGGVILGPCVMMRGPGWTSSWGPGRGRAGGSPGSPDFDDLMKMSRALADGQQVTLPHGAEKVASQSWLG